MHEPRKLKSDKWDHYFDIYDRCFTRYREKANPVYVEIGCQRGGSLETARKYFGEDARIYGIDIDPACEALNREPFVTKVFIGNQSDPALLDKAFKEIGNPDVIIDDGSHQSFDMVASFILAFPRLASEGTYLIEDVECCYFPSYQNNFHGLSAIEYFKGLTDNLALNSRVEQFQNSRFLQEPSKREGLLQLKKGILEYIYCISFYDSVIVVEKAKQNAEP